jgi:HEAT repeat protein
MRFHRVPSLLLCAVVLLGAVRSNPLAARPAAQQDGKLPPSELERLEKERQEKANEAERQKGKGGLVLPRPKVEAPAPTTPAPNAAPTEPVAQDPAAERTPDAILVELAAREQFQASEARGYAEELLAHGDAGLAAARRGLASDSHPVLLSCARAVLLAQDPAGMGILRGRLSRDLPTEAIAPLLRAVDELAPASMSGSDLVALLDHPQSTMRSAVERLLSERIGPADLPLVERALAAERTDTRLRAIELLGAIAGEGALDLLFAQLSDGRPQVAQRAAEILAVRPDPSVAPRLIESAFASGALFRGQCYALLALVEREDLRGEALVGPEHVDVLVQNMNSVSVFARSTAAVVLAGVGYRLEDESVPEWYRLGVPHELISIVVGNEYHRDFAALQVTALRRLEQITGRTFGNDGPAWKSWWITSAANFTPRRAALPGGEGAVATIRVEWLGSGGEVIRLAAQGARVPPRDEESTFLLDELDARALVAALEEQGLLSAARIPAAPRADSSERLAIGVGGFEKTFAFPLGVRPEHVESTLGHLRRLKAANDWQALRDPLLPGGPRALFNTHAAQWRELRAAPGEAGERARAERRKDLALAALVTMDPVKRGAVLDELVEAARTAGVVEADDAGQLVAIVDSEPYHSPRTTAVVRLLLDASRSSPGGPIDLAFGRDLFERVHDRFRGGALESLELIANEVGLELARELAYDERALARSVAASVLVHSSAAADTARLEILLADGEVELVQEATLIAVGRAQRTDLAHLVLARVELAPTRVRRAAAEALGELRPDGALDALVTCFTSDDVELQRAALVAIARFDDESAHAIVVRMLGRGPAHPLFDTARAACLELGPRVRLALAELAFDERAAGSDEAAIVLAQIGAPEAVPALLGRLARPGPTAERAAEELAVLTCLDLRTRADRSLAWKAWWEGAAQDEPLAWLRDAQVRLGLPVAPPGSLESGGSIDGALALAASVAAPAGVVSERARRELARLLGEDVSAPPVGQGLERWRSDLDAAIARRFANG